MYDTLVVYDTFAYTDVSKMYDTLAVYMLSLYTLHETLVVYGTFAYAAVSKMYVVVLHEILAYMLLLYIGSFSQNNPDAKGLYGVSFPYYDELSAVYSKDMAAGEGAKDMTDVVHNLEEELAPVNANDKEEEEDMTSEETPICSFDSMSSSLKKQKKEWKGKNTASSDSFLDMFNEVSSDLKVVTKSDGKMAQAMDREAANQEKERESKG
jgi:hypothetical protein